MRRLIRNWKTAVAAVCLIVFAAGLEAYFDLGANREQAANSSLAARTPRVHQVLNLSLGKGVRVHSSKGRLHAGNEFVTLAKAALAHQVRYAELPSYTAPPPNCNSGMQPFSIRPPPAS